MKTFSQFVLEEKSDDHMTIYRGENVGNKMGGPLGGKFYSTDKEYAHQFTQSGRDNEIQTRKISKDHVLDRSHIYAGDDIEPHLEDAKKHGYKAVRFHEGEDQPHSVYVFDHKVLKK